MSESKHTPGPWDWDSGIVPPDGPELYADVYAEAGDIIIASFNDCIPSGKANARLIAAAPDLLEALKETLREFPRYNRDYHLSLADAHDKARRAIAKAEGRS